MTQSSVEILTQLLLQVRDAAVTDVVTGVPNRLAAFQHLAALRCEYVTLGLLDLDRFKRVNDEHGHEMGDKVLRHAATVLRAAVQEDGGELFRIGGEEFVAVMPGSRGSAPDRWRRTLEQAPFEGLNVTVSIGVACGAPSDYTEMLKRADAACYRAKTDGRNCVRSGDADLAQDYDAMGPERVRAQDRAISRAEYEVVPLNAPPRNVIAASPEAAVSGLYQTLGVHGWLWVYSKSGDTSHWLLYVTETGAISDFSPWAESQMLVRSGPQGHKVPPIQLDQWL